MASDLEQNRSSKPVHTLKRWFSKPVHTLKRWFSKPVHTLKRWFSKPVHTLLMASDLEQNRADVWSIQSSS